MADEPLSADERAAILAEYDRLTAIPQPANKTPVGCAMVIVALALFIAAPYFLRRVWGAVHVAFIVIDTALVVGGVLLAVFGGGGGYAWTKMGAEAALELLSRRFDSATQQERRNAAVFLVANSVYSDGPSMLSIFDQDKAREQLGPALPYVIAVGAFLVAERKVYPVFASEQKDDAAAKS